jgi:leader peptidase (prepilin peptidase)/N-methyltransferase
MMTLFIVLAAVCGLAIGSFLNVVIYRVPQGLSIVRPRSACPRCGNEIRSRDNVPVVSWLLLRGSCRDCGEPISAFYPIVEIVTALAFTGIAWAALSSSLWSSPSASLASSLSLLAFLWLASAGISLIIIDAQVGRLPNAIVIPLYVSGATLLGISAILASDYAALFRALTGLAALSALYGLLFVTVPNGMGWGDVKLAGILGFFLGWVGWGALLIGALAAFVLGGLVGLWLIATKRAGRGSTIPFGPWMRVGAWGGIVWGNDLWSRYLSYVDFFVGVNQK